MMEYEVIEKGKDFLEIEVTDKALPNALLPILHEMGVDAYAYDNHPLVPGYRLRVVAKDPVKELKKAADKLSKDWKALAKSVEGKIPKK